MSREAYENPVEQVMFILGFKHDPKFDTALHAIARGSSPGILNALDQLKVYGAIDANFHAWNKVNESIREEIGSDVTPGLRNQVCQVIVDELNEEHYGGRWFDVDQTPPDEYWVNMGIHSPVFRRGEKEVFCLPAPYFQLLSNLFPQKKTAE